MTKGLKEFVDALELRSPEEKEVLALLAESDVGIEMATQIAVSEKDIRETILGILATREYYTDYGHDQAKSFNVILPALAKNISLLAKTKEEALLLFLDAVKAYDPHFPASGSVRKTTEAEINDVLFKVFK